MQSAESNNRGSLFKFQFGLRTLLYTITAACLILALCPLIVTAIGLFVVYAFIVFCLTLTIYAVCLATENTPRHLGRLGVIHAAIALFLLAGPIASYYINGRAWYDYGLSAWNPPPYRQSDGNIGIVDYDPAYTPPAVWPVIGPAMYAMCWFSVSLIYFPPTAPVVSIAMAVLAIRLRHLLTTRQSLFV